MLGGSHEVSNVQPRHSTAVRNNQYDIRAPHDSNHIPKKFIDSNIEKHIQKQNAKIIARSAVAGIFGYITMALLSNNMYVIIRRTLEQATCQY